MEKFARLEVHPFAEKFPLMSDTEFQGLVDDIREHGLREKIKIHQGKIIDGRNRESACYLLGIIPEYEEWSGTGSLIDYIISVNLHRRHLSVEQKAMLGAELAEMKKGYNTSTDGLLSQADAAKLLNVSVSSIQRAKKIINAGVTELPEKVRSGEISLAQAERIAKEPKTKQMRLIRRAGRAVIEIKSEQKVITKKIEPIHLCLVCNKAKELNDEAFIDFIDFLSQKFGGHYARHLQNMLEDFIGIKNLPDIENLNERIETAFSYGIHEFHELAKFTKTPADVLGEALRVGVFNHRWREEEKGGKTERARGAKKKLYFLSEGKPNLEICDECYKPSPNLRKTGGKRICAECRKDKLVCSRPVRDYRTVLGKYNFRDKAGLELIKYGSFAEVIKNEAAFADEQGNKLIKFTIYRSLKEEFLNV